VKEVIQIFCFSGAILIVMYGIWTTLYLMRRLSKREWESGILAKIIQAMVDEAVKRAPPVEAEEGAPFETYRKDLLRMVDGEISLDEFVEIWRGRKVEKRPKKVEAAAIVAEPPPKLDEAVERVFKNPALQSMLREWAFHVKVGGEGTKFGQLVRVWRLGPNNEERDAISAFVEFIYRRYWPQAFEAMKPYLDPGIVEIFAKENAQEFYYRFRDAMIHKHEWKCVEAEVPLGKQVCQTCGETFDPPKDVKASEIFGLINNVIKENAKSFADIIELEKKEVFQPGSNLMGWSDQVSSQRYEVPEASASECKWVRVTRPSSPAFGLLGIIRNAVPNGYLVEVRNVRNEPNFVSLEKGDFAHPPYPQEGEWWAFSRDLKPFVWKNEGFDLQKRLIFFTDLRVGALFPVNFGKGQ